MSWANIVMLMASIPSYEKKEGETIHLDDGGTAKRVDDMGEILPFVGG